MLDVDAVRELVHGHYAPMIAQQHGQPGAEALQSLLLALQTLYKHLEPETITHPLVVFKPLDDTARPLPEQQAVTLRSLEALAQEPRGPLVVQLLENGRPLIWRQQVSPSTLAHHGVVYSYSNRVETFFAKGESRIVKKLHAAYASNFSMPTFSELSSALEHYKVRLARVSTCEILTTAWFDENRIYFKAKPEATMRKSISQFLRCVLRDAEVRPEQNVDETHPVDIKVTWTFTNRLALIEIKWLGQSRQTDGSLATPYSASRARDGALQLADYLDSNKQNAPANVTRGYLVVMDGRRRGVVPTVSTISREDGMHYATQEIVYNPEYHKQRDDFEEPVRIFLEPRCA